MHLKGKRLKRYNELKDAFYAFKKEWYSDFIIEERKILLITEFYFDYVENHLKQHVVRSANSVINRFKIFSGTELAIMRFQPIQIKDKLEQSRINAELAEFVANSFFLKWCDLIEVNNEKLSRFYKLTEIELYRNKHKALLAKIDTEVSYPIVEISHSWLLFYILACKEICIKPEVLNYIENQEN